ncbi:MAG: hypothetical protein AAGE94_16100 [Acidobacteriota bacterium]
MLLQISASRPSTVRTVASCLSALLIAVLAVPAPAVAQADQSLIALPIYQGRTTNQVFLFDLANGGASRLDDLSDRDEVRLRPLGENLFDTIGRGAGQSARVGEMLVGPIRDSGGTTRSALVVESSAGYPLYFERLGRSGKIGEAITFLGRPFEGLASPDGNFALLMRRSESGQTVGATLYHGGSGRAIHISGVDELKIDPDLTITEGLPTVTGPITAVPITFEERSMSYLIIDANGNLLFLDAFGTRLQARETNVSIAPSFQAETLQTTPRRFAAVPLQNSDASTVAVLVADAATGGLGLIVAGDNDLRRGTPRLQMLPRNLYQALPGGIVDAPRVFEAVAHHSSSGTRGAWILDSLTRAILFVERPDDPAAVQIVRPAIQR